MFDRKLKKLEENSDRMNEKLSSIFFIRLLDLSTLLRIFFFRFKNFVLIFIEILYDFLKFSSVYSIRIILFWFQFFRPLIFSIKLPIYSTTFLTFLPEISFDFLKFFSCFSNTLDFFFDFLETSWIVYVFFIFLRVFYFLFPFF